MSAAGPAAEITRLEAERRVALLGKDIGALRRLLHDDLVYMHSSGVTDTKASYISGVETGVWDYRRIESDPPLLKLHGGTVLMFMRLSIGLLTGKVAKDIESTALAVWVTGSGGWQLAAMQSAAVPASTHGQT